ncbi:hypothetical protein KFE80_11900 [bacterium SCSIO 12696]|nr:hypothetical protein KFE80_11900 [bacterium SCSIO 12696]
MTITTMKKSAMKKTVLLSVCLMFLSGCEKPPPKRSELPVVLRAEYTDNNCGPNSPHIKLLEETLPAATGEDLPLGFEFFTAEGIRNPDDPEMGFAMAGNVYELEGYYYYHIEYGRRILEPRFDLLGWRLISPYKLADGTVNNSGQPYAEYWDRPKQESMVFQTSRSYQSNCPE